MHFDFSCVFCQPRADPLGSYLQFFVLASLATSRARSLRFADRSHEKLLLHSKRLGKDLLLMAV